MLVETVTNQLFYELIGCFSDRTGEVYRPGGTSEHVSRPLVREFFARDITNSAEKGVGPIIFASVQFGPSLSRGADQCHGKARFEGHGHLRGLFYLFDRHTGKHESLETADEAAALPVR